ncbi:MAG: 50S ribosomal protein L11 methyltransferase [Planctomycetota bacterium]|nr:50S ribosomal protein L11 methyltransferase [Planctomycetota bacterium]
MTKSARSKSDSNQTLLRFQIPNTWDETLVALLEAQGLGRAVAESTYAPGALASDAEDPSRACEVRLLTSTEGSKEVVAIVQSWFEAWGLNADQWCIDQEEHDATETDSEALWQASWRPFRCAGYVIHADFHPREGLTLRPADIPLTLFAGSAFGTGGHASTRLALKVLTEWCKDNPPIRLLDVGSGSGILAVAAALRGVKEVVGMDPDPQSAPQAAKTARANGVGTQCQFWRGGYETARGTWPAVMANLVADLLQDGARDLAQLVAPQGKLFAGGILDVHWQATCDAFASKGLQLEQKLERGRWRAGIWFKP